MAKFLRNTLERHANILASFLPNGPLFAKKNEKGTAQRRTLEGVSETYRQTEDFIVSYVEQYNLLATENFITEWEAMVGIPDNIFSATSPASITLQQRRNQVLFKLRANGLQTIEDFIDIAALIGFIIEIFPATEVLPGPILSPAVNVWTVTGGGLVGAIPPLDVPFIPGGIPTLVQLFENYKPIHTVVDFLET